jgi:hypothetical protein
MGLGALITSVFLPPSFYNLHKPKKGKKEKKEKKKGLFSERQYWKLEYPGRPSHSKPNST